MHVSRHMVQPKDMSGSCVATDLKSYFPLHELDVPSEVKLFASVLKRTSALSDHRPWSNCKCRQHSQKLFYHRNPKHSARHFSTAVSLEIGSVRHSSLILGLRVNVVGVAAIVGNVLHVVDGVDYGILGAGSTHSCGCVSRVQMPLIGPMLFETRYDIGGIFAFTERGGD